MLCWWIKCASYLAGISHTMLGLTSEALHLSNNYKSASDIYVV